MSESLDKQVNAYKESCSRKPMKKCAMKMKVELEKNDARVTMLLVEGRS